MDCVLILGCGCLLLIWLLGELDGLCCLVCGLLLWQITC